MKIINLQFDGYWRESVKEAIPAQSGIYCVYSGIHNVSASTVTLKKLIYIGESADVRCRIIGHEKTDQWKRHLSYGETLIFSFAPIFIDRLQGEAALIHHHKPPVNSEYCSSFPYGDTQAVITGSSALLTSTFIVRSTVGMKNYGSLY